ncbi:MAG: c-type cytochrome biogenesis protein CcmI [Proteobacteria bacterium]|nr:c-type cytochrome biogenesis protein CcmI [Pseudomonadota bacterium]
MIWLALALLALVAMAPLALSARRTAQARGRREAALALHRAQLQELDRDLADGQMGPEEHASAVLEVQRRLLAAAEAPDDTAGGGGGRALLVALVLVPAAALALYLVGGAPGLPSIRHADVAAEAQARGAQEEALIERMRAALSKLDPKSDKAREGYILLGNAEASRGNMAGAAAAWGTALDAQFDPTLAAETAEAMTEAAGHLTDASTALFRRALAEAPPDAPWRPMVEKRLAGAK